MFRKLVWATVLLLFFATALQGKPLAQRFAGSKLGRWIGGALLATVFVCGSGCDYGATQSVQQILGEKREDDQDLIIIVDGVVWHGYQRGSVGYLHSVVADEYGAITFVQTVGGFKGEAVPDHPHIGAQVYLDHDGFRWFGNVKAIFDSNLKYNHAFDLYQISVNDWLYLGEDGADVAPEYIPSSILAYQQGAGDSAGFVFSMESEDE